jgi:translation initiation factor 4G
MCVYFVREPVRGGKEKVLQEMLANGTKYDRKLTFEGFIHAMTKNKTNILLMIQGFFTNVPWGIIFTFLNDYLSQEQGLSVPASTFLVLMFGIGSALGGVCGGFIGSLCMRVNRILLPLFMSISTLLGILPFLGLLDWNLSGPGFIGISLCLAGGVIANLPSVNVRPCILNVNPPETRGAAMTANNLMINVARGAGPSLITLSQSFFGVSRQYSFNVTVSMIPLRDYLLFMPSHHFTFFSCHS